MLIDKTYFNGLLNIPNTAEPEPNNRSANILQDVIDISEKEVLSYALGVQMWDDLRDAFTADTLSEAYKRLLYGYSYTRHGKNYVWVGIIPDNEPKTSFLADYAYWLYSTHQITQATENGQVAPDVKIGARVSSTPKVTEAWNRFIAVFNGSRYSGGVSGYTPEGNPFWYVDRRLGNGYGVDYYGYNSNGGEVSLMQFLKDFKDDYPLLVMPDFNAPFSFKNSFGI